MKSMMFIMGIASILVGIICMTKDINQVPMGTLNILMGWFVIWTIIEQNGPKHCDCNPKKDSQFQDEDLKVDKAYRERFIKLLNESKN